MARSRHLDDFDGDDDDFPDGVYRDDNDSVMVPCPYCREPILEEAQYCPKCENYLSHEDAPAGSKPAWIWVCLLLGLAAMIWTSF